MAAIDEERLQTLMELVNKENPDLQPYVKWVIYVNHFLNEQGIYGDEILAVMSAIFSWRAAGLARKLLFWYNSKCLLIQLALYSGVV